MLGLENLKIPPFCEDQISSVTHGIQIRCSTFERFEYIGQNFISFDVVARRRSIKGLSIKIELLVEDSLYAYELEKNIEGLKQLD